MSVNVARAARAAKIFHHNQTRRHTGDPYFFHLVEVAGLSAMAVVQDTWEVSDDTIQMVGYLHDCMEDCGVTFYELESMFGQDVANGVQWLTNSEKGNRAHRKAQAAYRLRQAPGWVQSIKCADFVSNIRSIARYEPEFFKVYADEVADFLSGMIKADPFLKGMAWTELRKAQNAAALVFTP